MDFTPREALYLAIEQGERGWKLAFTTGFGQAPRFKGIPAGDVDRLTEEIGRARKRFRLSPDAPVRSCYEAGREGFWLHRCLLFHGVDSLVVDSSSIEVNRRARRAKADRLDAGKLVTQLLRYHHGDRKTWSVVRVPSVSEEDARHLHRELKTLKQSRTRLTNRIRGMLVAHSIRQPGPIRTLRERLEQLRSWDDSPLPAGLRGRVERECEELAFIEGRIRRLEVERRRILREEQSPALDQVRQLLALKALGIESSWVFVMEFFAWRRFRNRRQVGSLAGMTPTPYQRGNSNKEQGIGKDGKRHVRAMAVEIAWVWLRYQPDSALTLWYQRRFAKGGPRARRVGVVAVARKLLIELWRYLETGALPEGAVTKA
jgi:transposase